MTTFAFEDVPAGLLQGYAAQGFTFSTWKSPNALDKAAFWNRSQITDLGTGAYLINQQSNDTVVVKNDSGATFGATSIAINGFNFLGWNGNAPITGTAVVTFNFTGVLSNGDLVTYTRTTDTIDGFQTVVLPGEFSAGLTEFRWRISGGTGWGAFDNLVLTANHTPVASNFSAAIIGGETFTGHVVATDADGQALTFQAVGALPDGVVLDEDGTFYILPADDDGEMLPGQSRTISFQYVASDGDAQSNTATVTVTVGALPAGADIHGGNHPQSLLGTAAGERLWGGNSGDTLNGQGGADRLYGANGKDVLLGGAGRDQLFGENGSDTLNGGTGDDTLTGGNSPDIFVFDADFGHDVIADFDIKNETVAFSVSNFVNFDDVRAHAAQVGTSVVITLDADNSVTLLNVKLSQLNAGDFLFY